MIRWVACVFLASGLLAAQPKRILYVTHSAGYRHDCLPISAEALRQVAARNGQLELTATEDLSLITAAGLSEFDAVLFFTSGELALSETQKADLLEFVRGGKGFGGAHSATDTLYTWPEYGELIGARFYGHPWVQVARADVEDPDHPASSPVQPSFSLLEEFYQFREFSRNRSRVLMTLDLNSVDRNAAGVNPGTEDFPLAWCHPYGRGRVFYTALGHFESTWRDERFQRTMLGAMLWLTGQAEGAAEPRPAGTPEILPDGVGNSATFQPRMTVSPGSWITIFGRGLTAGSTMTGRAFELPFRLAGSTVKIDGRPIPLLYASPTQINAFIALDTKPRVFAPPCPFGCPGPSFDMEISVGEGGLRGTVIAKLNAVEATPGVFTITRASNSITLWATGLGPVDANGNLFVTRTQPVVKIDGSPARVLFSGLAPGWVGLYQVNVELPVLPAGPIPVDFEFGPYRQSMWLPPT